MNNKEAIIFLIGSMISADFLIKEKDYHTSYKILTELKSSFCDEPEIIELIDRAIPVVISEYKERFLKELN